MTNCCPSPRISILWISSRPGALKLADIFGKGTMVRNGSVRFGRRPKRTGTLPRSENNSLAVSSATVAAAGSVMSISMAGTNAVKTPVLVPGQRVISAELASVVFCQAGIAGTLPLQGIGA